MALKTSKQRCVWKVILGRSRSCSIHTALPLHALQRPATATGHTIPTHTHNTQSNTGAIQSWKQQQDFNLGEHDSVRDDYVHDDEMRGKQTNAKWNRTTAAAAICTNYYFRCAVLGYAKISLNYQRLLQRWSWFALSITHGDGSRRDSRAAIDSAQW